MYFTLNKMFNMLKTHLFNPSFIDKFEIEHYKIDILFRNEKKNIKH